MIRPILLYPDPGLRVKCAPVAAADPAARSTVRDLVDTLKSSPGVAIAAPQIGATQRIILLNIGKEKKGHGLLALLNPEILFHEGEIIFREGCLSIPEFTANVRRYERVIVKGLSPDGDTREYDSVGLEAVAFQHEIDHLDGILFLDRVSSLKTDLFRRKGY